MGEEKTNKQLLKVSYKETTALYASQFVINSSREELTLNFSSGPISDPAGGEAILPIHTRIALTPATARRLHALLGKVLANQHSKPSDDGKVPITPTDPQQRH